MCAATTSSTTTSTTTPTTTTSTTTTTTLPSNPCEGILLGNQPMPNNCTMFYRCVNEVALPQQCPTGEIFSTEFLQCVPGDANSCS